MDDSSTMALTTMNPSEIVATLREGLLILTDDLTVEFASDRFLKMFQVNREETLGRPLSDLGDGQWNIPALLEPLSAIVAQVLTLEDLEVEHHFDHIGRKVMRLNGRKTVWQAKMKWFCFLHWRVRLRSMLSLRIMVRRSPSRDHAAHDPAEQWTGSSLQPL